MGRCDPAKLSLVTLVLLATSVGAVCADEAGGSTGAPSSGFAVSADLYYDLRRSTTGGLERGDAVSNLLVLGAEWTPASGPLSATVNVIRNGGEAISGRYVGDLQGLNNIEAPAGWRLYEAWGEIAMGGGVGLRAGFLDLNAEFDHAITSAFFNGSPFGIGTDLAQTGLNGPAVYPVTALGVRLAGRAGRWAWRTALYDGVPGRLDRDRFVELDVGGDQGVLAIGEVEAPADGFHRIAVGVWTYTSAFDRVDATPASVPAYGNRGIYALADKPLGTVGGANVDGVVRVGVADGRFNAVGTYVGFGLVMNHFSEARADDAAGLAVAHGRTGDAFRRSLAGNGGVPAVAETAVELTYRAYFTPWLSLSPSAQWVRRPGADRTLRDAAVIGVRFELSTRKDL